MQNIWPKTQHLCEFHRLIRRSTRPPIPITDQCFNRAEAIAMSKSYVSGLPASLLVSAVASGSLQVMLMAEILEREGQKSAWFNPPASDLEATPSPESRPAWFSELQLYPAPSGVFLPEIGFPPTPL
jgi:hypothetical protein